MTEDEVKLLICKPEKAKSWFALNGQTSLDTLYSVVNRVLAVVILLGLSPLLMFIALRCRKENGSPILFGHWRVGQKGKLFRCLKFRSMVLNADQVLFEHLESDANAAKEWAATQKLLNDPRVTKIGSFLRKTSLDELPQLFNVVRGEMNLVGPRPVTVQEMSRYKEFKRHYLTVKPGMTGLWQVSGRNNTTYDERIQLDYDYMQTRNPIRDLMIVFRTFRVIITREGAA